MYHEERIRLKWAGFVIKLKQQASGKSAREMLVAPAFHEGKKQNYSVAWARCFGEVVCCRWMQ